MNNGFELGSNIGSVVSSLFAGKNREPGQAYYDQLKQNYGILGEKNRADKAFEEAGSQRAMNIARNALTPELMARFQSGDARANAELAAAILRTAPTPNLSNYTAGALQNQELGFRQEARDAALPELGGMNANLAALSNGPVVVNAIDDGYQLNPLELGGAAIPTQGKVADISKTNREVFDNGSGVYNVDFGTNSATPITVGPMPELGQVQNQYAELGAKHGFATTSTTRSAAENERVNGVKNSQHLTGSARDWSVKGKSPEQVQAFLSDLRSQGFEAFTHDAGSGMHVHAELPPGSRRGTPSLLSGKPGGGTSDKAPSGYRWGADGNLVAIPGGPADKASGGGQTQVIENADGTQTIIPGGKTTEDMNKSAGYALRMERALEDIAAAEKLDPDANRPGVGVALLDMLPTALGNAGKSAERQNVEAAQLDALDAALTLNTGAAYTKEQLQSLRKAYFPQVYDKPPAIEGKKRRLEGLIKTARLRARGAYPQTHGGELGAAKPPGAAQVAQVRSAADYTALPSGTVYTDPNGVQRRKP